MFTTFPASASYGDFIFLWEQLVYSVMEKKNISEFILLPHWYCKYYSSEFYTVLLLIVKRFCGKSPHCQSERQSFWDFTAFIIATCLHMFCNEPKKKKTKHPPPLQKNSLCLQTCAIRKPRTHPACSSMSGHCGSVLRSGSVDSLCCWSWQQVRDWERPLGCKRKGS